MAKLHIVYRCSDCGALAPKWTGKCSNCSAWNTIFEDVVDEAEQREEIEVLAVKNRVQADPPLLASEITSETAVAQPTGQEEFDRVLGGGLVSGSVTLIGGEPGIGKSTLVLQIAGTLCMKDRKVMLVCGEESIEQVARRATRLGIKTDHLYLAYQTSVGAVVAAADMIKPDVLIVDSIQTLTNEETSASSGSVAAVRAATHALTGYAKQHSVATIIVGHVTKDGALAGPRVLEHMVDTVLQFEGDRHHDLRLLRALKHRYGATGELGVFEMTSQGLIEVNDPSGVFLADRLKDAPGTVVVPILDGARPLLVEVQALVSEQIGDYPRRIAQGYELGRLNMLCAVLASRCEIPLARQDIYISVAGGIKITEPSADLGIALAIISSLIKLPIPESTIAVGEVGLVGEVRHVSQTARRLGEVSRLGFNKAIVPADTVYLGGEFGSLKVNAVSTLPQAIVESGLAIGFGR